MNDTISDTDTAPTEGIAAALQRLRRLLDARPRGPRTTSVTATLGPRLTCTTEIGSTTVATDVSPALGGTASAPTPSELLYTALASCLAIGYRMRAAERGIELTHVRVTVEGDADVTGMLTPCATSPGATALRYRVEIDSPAPADEVAAIVDIADRLSPVLADLTRPVPATRTLAINAGTAA